MYRQTYSSGGVVPTTQLKLKSNGENDSETRESLRRKREQIDQEIEEFRAAKEREFQEFERSLRKQKRGRRRSSGAKETQNDMRPGALSLLDPRGKQQTNGVPHQQRDRESPKRPSAPLSRPTTGVDKLSITAELPPTPMKSKFPNTKPPTSPQPKSLSPVRSKKSDQSSTSKSRPQPSPLTPPDEARDGFAGVFTPTFLPLLDSRPGDKSASPPPPRHGSFSLPDSGSHPSISPMRRSDRSNTEPVIPSTSLPSALRTASGTAVRKRKHVTFQLADSAIVEPSSSYEEMPSPSPKDERNRDGILDEEAVSSDEDVPAPKNGLALAVPSPDLRGKDKQFLINPSETSPGDLTNAIQGSGAGGFFELDEELTSPGLDAGKRFMDDFDDIETSPVESRDRSLEGSLDRGGKRRERSPKQQRYEYGGSVPIDIVRPSSSWVGSFGH